MKSRTVKSRSAIMAEVAALLRELPSTESAAVVVWKNGEPTVLGVIEQNVCCWTHMVHGLNTYVGEQRQKNVINADDYN